MALVSAYVTMLPRLQAAEQLERVRAGALVMGDYEKDDARAMLDELQQRALGDPSTLRQAQGSGRAAGRARKAGADDLAGMGIGAVMMPPPPPGAAPVDGFDYV